MDTPTQQPNAEAQIYILQSENRWLKDSHSKLERENSELRVSNEKLRIENNDLTIKHQTGEKEKELALKHQEVSQRKGLGSIGSPEEINSFLTGIADMIKSFKGGGDNPGSQVGAIAGLSAIKQEVLSFLTEKMNSITDDQAQKIAFIFKTILEKEKIEYMYQNWTDSGSQATVLG
jgi:hypothetical protein